MKNTQKIQQIGPKSVKYALIRVQSDKFYTRQMFFYTGAACGPVTNMRYGHQVNMVIWSIWSSGHLVIWSIWSYSQYGHLVNMVI